jgi:cytochrome c553
LSRVKTLVLIIVALIAVGAIIAAVVILNLPTPPDIPSDEIHEGRTTCFGCHDTGENDAPEFPSWHFDDIEDGKLTEDIDDCLRCHERAG